MEIKITLTLDEREVRQALAREAQKKRPDLFPDGSKVTVRVTAGTDFLQATVWPTESKER